MKNEKANEKKLNTQNIQLEEGRNESAASAASEKGAISVAEPAEKSDASTDEASQEPAVESSSDASGSDSALVVEAETVSGATASDTASEPEVRSAPDTSASDAEQETDPEPISDASDSNAIPEPEAKPASDAPAGNPVPEETAPAPDDAIDDDATQIFRPESASEQQSEPEPEPEPAKQETPETEETKDTPAAGDEPTTYIANPRIVDANPPAVAKVEETANKAPAHTEPDKKSKGAQVVRADSVQTEDVPTIPIDSLQIISTLAPEVAVHSIASMRGTDLQTPLVAQTAEHQRSVSEWIGIWRDGIRLKYVPLSLLPVIVGSALAWMQTVQQQHHLVLPGIIHLIGIIVAVIAMQIGANLVNDYYDHQNGVDTSNALGPGGLIQQGFIKPFNVLVTGFALLVLGAIIGLITAIAGGVVACLLIVVSALAAYFFSASRWALSLWGLSELTGFLVFGPFTVIAAYLVQNHGVYTHSALLYSLPLGLLAAAVIYANNLRDNEGDQHAHKRTLALILKTAPSRGIYVLLLLLAYAIVIDLGFPHGAPHFILLTLWTFPTLIVAITGIIRTKIAAGFHDVMQQSLKLQAFFSIYLTIGFIVTALLTLLPSLPTIKLPF